MALLRSAGEGFIRDQCHRLAAAISYYALFSLFPLLIVLLSLLGIFLHGGGFQHRLIQSVIELIPTSHRESQNVLISAIRQISDTDKGTLSVFGILLMALSASSLFGSVRSSINIAYHQQSPRGVVHRKLMDLAMVPMMGLFFFLSVILTAIIEGIRKLSGHWVLIDRASFLNHLVGESGVIWNLLSYSVPFLLTVVGFVLLYWLIPHPRLSLKRIWRGALIASILFEVCKFAFVFYLDSFARYDVVFGSLGAVAAFLFWVYLSAMILLFGAELISASLG